MMETLWMIEPWHWLVLGFILLIVEMFVPTFASLWFGAAAIIVAALAWLMPISVSVQIIIWLILSAVFLVVWFKFVQPLSVDRTKAGLGGSVIVGETGMIVVQPQPDRAGIVRFSVPIVGAAEWRCRTTGEMIAVGDRVVVTDIVGNELVVSSMQSQAAINKNMHV